MFPWQRKNIVAKSMWNNIRCSADLCNKKPIPLKNKSNSYLPTIGNCGVSRMNRSGTSHPWKVKRWRMWWRQGRGCFPSTPRLWSIMSHTLPSSPPAACVRSWASRTGVSPCSGPSACWGSWSWCASCRRCAGSWWCWWRPWTTWPPSACSSCSSSSSSGEDPCSYHRFIYMSECTYEQQWMNSWLTIDVHV